MAKKRKRKEKSNTGKHAEHEKKEPNPNVNNPLLLKQQSFLQRLSPSEREEFFSSATVSPERRAQIWMEQAEIGEELVNQYSWATPDERALKILKEFSPLVEIGCGRNAYWCRFMRAHGVDVVGYDREPHEGGIIQSGKPTGEHQKFENLSFKVYKGGPEMLRLDENSKRTLFLCYPDETAGNEHRDGDAFKEKIGNDDSDENDSQPSLGSACLEHYQGEYVIHVGELFCDASLSMDQAPWGRSSSPEFQQQLAAEFHCVLRVGLPGWLHVRDTLTVWKRSEVCTLVFAAEDEDEDDEEEEEVEYRYIPKDERLPIDIAAPCFLYLIQNSALCPSHQSITQNEHDTGQTKQNPPPVACVSKSKDFESPW